jgi:hypothetical protein
MNENQKRECQKDIMKLIDKSAEEKEPLKSMQFAQAAVSCANAYAVLCNYMLIKEK